VFARRIETTSFQKKFVTRNVLVIGGFDTLLVPLVATQPLWHSLIPFAYFVDFAVNHFVIKLSHALHHPHPARIGDAPSGMIQAAHRQTTFKNYGNNKKLRVTSSEFFII